MINKRTTNGASSHLDEERVTTRFRFADNVYHRHAGLTRNPNISEFGRMSVQSQLNQLLPQNAPPLFRNRSKFLTCAVYSALCLYLGRLLKVDIRGTACDYAAKGI